MWGRDVGSMSRSAAPEPLRRAIGTGRGARWDEAIHRGGTDPIWRVAGGRIVNSCGRVVHLWFPVRGSAPAMAPAGAVAQAGGPARESAGGPRSPTGGDPVLIGSRGW